MKRILTSISIAALIWSAVFAAGDEQGDVSQPDAYTAMKFYKASDELLPSGLLGPVTLERY